MSVVEAQDDEANAQGGLPVRMVDKPWGVKHLPAPFVTPRDEQGAERQIGEMWFEPPAALPQLLVKYIFTSDKLSVQVHPSDTQTLAMGLGKQGKEECWLVLATEPGATLGIGFREEIDGETMRAAALDGSIEQMMVWHDVVPGDFFYIPANTVHAIGAGVTVMEVQQNSDITYRLYDYGRPRELHLDEGMAVARGESYPADLHRRVEERGEVTLVDGPLFRLDRTDGPPSEARAAHYAGAPLLVIPRDEGISVGAVPLAVGECALARGIDEVAVKGGARALLARPL